MPHGLKVSQKYVRARASIPDPDSEDDLLGAPRAQPEPPAPAKKTKAPAPAAKDGGKPAALAAHGAGCGCGACAPAQLAAELADPDETDEIVAAGLEDWREISDPLLAGLLAAVNGAASFEDALARIDRARIDSAPLQRALAIATAKGRGLGDVKD